MTQVEHQHQQAADGPPRAHRDATSSRHGHLKATHRCAAAAADWQAVLDGAGFRQSVPGAAREAAVRGDGAKAQRLYRALVVGLGGGSSIDAAKAIAIMAVNPGDYWDYIGWKDSFASPENTNRQRAYAAAAGDRTIYTPQLIVGGQDHVIGYKPMKLAMLIDEHRDALDMIWLINHGQRRIA